MEKLIVLGLLACLATMQCQAASSTTEAALVRCPRLLCDLPCNYGHEEDEHGCDTCTCRPSPCEAVDCPADEHCILKDCEGEVCFPYETECVADEHPVVETTTCRPVLCRMFCQYGWKRNEEGCEVCQCEEPPCPVLPCADDCEYGNEEDELGCPTCTCKPHPCEEKECPEGHRCETYQTLCEDGEDCMIQARCDPLIGPLHPVEPVEHQRPAGMACPLYQCFMFCEFGFKKGPDDCDICDCNMTPCDAKDCGDKQVCKVTDQECGMADGTCQIANCTLKPLCQQELEKVEAKHLLGVQMPNCDDDGGYEPTQCSHVTGECWCVDDSGQEMPDTRKNVRAAGATPLHCPANYTSALHGRFKLDHDFDDVSPHLANLRELTQKMLSEWMVVSRQYIIVVEMRPASEHVHLLEVFFMVHTDEKAVHDLATCSKHLQEQAQDQNLAMEYRGHALVPQSESLHIHHQYTPMLPPVGVREEPIDFYHEHQAVLVSCLIGILFFLVVLTVLIKLLVARRNMKNGQLTLDALTAEDMPRHRYKKNLAFSTTFKSGDEEKKVVLTDAEDMGRVALA